MGNNRFFENLKTGKISPGSVITLSDLTVSELAGSMGILNQMDDPELNKVIDEVAAKVKTAGKIPGTAAGGFPRWKERGVDCGDCGAMAAGMRAFKRECENA